MTGPRVAVVPPGLDPAVSMSTSFRPTTPHHTVNQECLMTAHSRNQREFEIAGPFATRPARPTSTTVLGLAAWCERTRQRNLHRDSRNPRENLLRRCSAAHQARVPRQERPLVSRARDRQIARFECPALASRRPHSKARSYSPDHVEKHLHPPRPGGSLRICNQLHDMQLLQRALLDSNQRPPACKECSKVTDSGDFRVEYGFFARSCPVRRRSITVLNRSARCNWDAKRVGLRCGAILRHSGPQLRTSRTLLDSWACWMPRRG